MNCCFLVININVDVRLFYFIFFIVKFRSIRDVDFFCFCRHVCNIILNYPGILPIYDATFNFFVLSCKLFCVSFCPFVMRSTYRFDCCIVFVFLIPFKLRAIFVFNFAWYWLLYAVLFSSQLYIVKIGRNLDVLFIATFWKCIDNFTNLFAVCATYTVIFQKVHSCIRLWENIP